MYYSSAIVTTDKDLLRVHTDIENDVRKHGRSIICVGRCIDDDDEGFIPFAYTIGNWITWLPELLVIGTFHGSFLNTLSEKLIRRRAAFDYGELVSVGGEHPVKIITANQSAQREYTIQAGQYYGFEDYAVQQVLLCDRRGRFPDDPQCRHPYCKVPVLWKA